jgi:hypothetical protein
MAGFVLSMFQEYKIAIVLIVLLAYPALSSDGQLTVQRIEGDVYVRHGVAEKWSEATPGSTLRPEDTIRTGRNASAILRRVDGTVYRIPPVTMVDVSDFRSMSREELLLRLAMEDMLSVPERIDDDRPLPRTTVLHGRSRERADDTADLDLTMARYRVNGARYLIEQDYRGSAVLKIRETLRLYPEGEYRIGAMMLAAESLESMELFEEASRYYRTVLDEGTDAHILRTAEMKLEKIRGQ